MSEVLAGLIAAETAREIPAPVRMFAAALAAETNNMATAVLFYGSNLRTGGLDGVLDFYVLVDKFEAWHHGRITRLANRILPPHVEYREYTAANRTLRAKVAVMTLEKFARATRPASPDTTIWARFSQPAAIIWVRDSAARTATITLLAAATQTAARWAALLGPEEGTPGDYWRALYAATYSAELRVERAARSHEIVARAADRYAQLLKPAWLAAGIAFSDGPGDVRPHISAAERRAARRAWAMRRRLGKPLNVVRLVKAAFTFKGGASYLAWKVERHTKIALALTPWQKRHPILAAPGALWRLWRQGGL